MTEEEGFSPFDLMVGHKTTLYFSNGHPPYTGIVEFLSEEYIRLGDKRFRLEDVVRFSVDLR